MSTRQHLETPLTLREASDKVLRQLDDEDEDVWTRSQIEDWVQDGYDKLCRESKCLFDMLMFDRQPALGNHTRDFETEYMDGPIFARFNFTRESEREHVEPGAKGPVNHTRLSEASYFTTSGEPASVKTTNELPDGWVDVERVLHDWLRIRPENARWLRRSRNIYETEQGGVFTYSMDQDGLFTIRTVGVPVSAVSPIEISGTWGAIRAFTGDTDFDWSGETVVAPDGGYGVIRSVPREFVSESQQYGAPRRVVEDTNATRVEYYRLGKPLSGHAFEVPNRFVKYVEWWALHRAYSQPGEGEDKRLAEHYKGRFEEGVQRLINRKKDVTKERAYGMGQRREGSVDSYLERFPSNYGRKRPFRG
jgi:hypothetical protein